MHFSKSLAHLEEIKKQAKKLHECGTNNKSNLGLYIGIGLYRSHAQSLSHVWLFCDSMDCSRPVSSVHGISQSRILEWIAIPFSRGSSELRNQTWNSCIWQMGSLPLKPPVQSYASQIVNFDFFFFFLTESPSIKRVVRQSDRHL